MLPQDYYLVKNDTRNMILKIEILIKKGYYGYNLL